MTTPQIYLVIGIAFSVILICGAILFINRYTLTRIKAERHKAEKTKEESKHALQILAEREAKTTKQEQELTEAKEHFKRLVKRYARSFQTINEDNFSYKGMSNLFDVLTPKEHVLFDVAYYLLEGDCSYRKLYQTLHERDADTVDFVSSLATDWGIEEASQLKFSEAFIQATLKKRASTAQEAGLVPISFQETFDTFYLLQGKQGTSRRLVSGSELIHIWQERQKEKKPNIDAETAKILTENKATKQAQNNGSTPKQGAAKS